MGPEFPGGILTIPSPLASPETTSLGRLSPAQERPPRGLSFGNNSLILLYF